jgi:rhodanese-related sulfurtransferase
MKTINTAELEELRDNGERFYLINVLSEKDFEEEHIPGSVNIPVDRLKDEATEKFDREDRIVVYCASEDCGASENAARDLDQLGFQNVQDYEPGLKGWKEAGNNTV